MLRRLLVSSAQYILGPVGPDCELRRWGLALAERGGGNAKKRAVIALARTLVAVLHRLWVSGAVYQCTPRGWWKPLAFRRRMIVANFGG